jgi:hypothetical protein
VDRLIGGSDDRPCPPNADCMRPGDPPLADGAAYRPATGEWRKLPDAPVGLRFGTDTILIGDTLYLWADEVHDRPKSSGALLAYQIKQNRWQELPLPSGHTLDWYDATRAGDRIVLYRGGDEKGEQPDLVYDPVRRTWSELPADPDSPSGSRSMV